MPVKSQTLLAGGGAGGTALAYGHVKAVSLALFTGQWTPQALDSAAELTTAIAMGLGGCLLLALTNWRMKLTARIGNRTVSVVPQEPEEPEEPEKQ